MRILEAFNQYFEMIPANTDELRQEVYKLRYQVYCLEHKFLEPSAEGMEYDEYDAHSCHYLIQHKDKTLKVVAISLDTKKADWITFIINNPSNFINLCDLNGWDSKIATDYFLNATPTMFLLDANKKIIGKPTTFEELQALIKF